MDRACYDYGEGEEKQELPQKASPSFKGEVKEPLPEDKVEYPYKSVYYCCLSYLRPGEPEQVSVKKGLHGLRAMGRPVQGKDRKGRGKDVDNPNERLHVDPSLDDPRKGHQNGAEDGEDQGKEI